MTELCFTDLYSFLESLKKLKRARIDKINFYYLDKNKKKFVLIIDIYKNKKLSLVITDSYPFLTENAKELKKLLAHASIKRDDNLTTQIKVKLYKYINNFYVCKNERILVIESSNSKAKHFIFFEFFSKGNIIICDNSLKIIFCLRKIKLKSKIVELGYSYNINFDDLFTNIHDFLESLSYNEFKEILEKSDKNSIVKKLAVDLRFGRKIAKQILDNYNQLAEPSLIINENAKKLDEKQLKDLFEITKKTLLNYVNQSFPNNYFFRDLQNFISQHFKKYSEKEKIKLIINKQLEAISNLESEYKQNKIKAEMIYKHYKEIEEILNAIKDLKSKGKDEQEIKEYLNKYKFFKDIKNKYLYLEFDEQ